MLNLGLYIVDLESELIGQDIPEILYPYGQFRFYFFIQRFSLDIYQRMILSLIFFFSFRLIEL